MIVPEAFGATDQPDLIFTGPNYFLGVVILALLLLIYWQSSLLMTSLDGSAASPTQAVAAVGRNITTIGSCRPDNPLRLITVDALDSLWQQYTLVSTTSPCEAAHGLYFALSDIEDELYSLADAVEAADSVVAQYEAPDWAHHAACAFRELPRNVHLLGVLLELE
jgi:hypothetical protein